MVKECPMVFDGNIKSMNGETFQIHLTDNAKPFCINLQQSILYACHDE